jgi:hypothetical protein
MYMGAVVIFLLNTLFLVRVSGSGSDRVPSESSSFCNLVTFCPGTVTPGDAARRGKCARAPMGTTCRIEHLNAKALFARTRESR